MGSRASNPVDQWPDPDVYVHAASGQQLSGSETRNINRAYPGRPDGNPTEQAAYAIAELIRAEDINETFDLHEASPEYPVINATVSHEKGMSLAAAGMMELTLGGIQMSLGAVSGQSARTDPQGTGRLYGYDSAADGDG